MAINIKFDLTGNPEPPTIILANRNGNKLGQLKVNEDSIDLSDKFNDASELSFTVNKYVDGELTPLWDKLVDFKLVYCKEWNMWFEIKVELDEATESIKTVFCTQLGQAELSQIILYNIEINTEEDIEREDYKISILWDENNPKSSILDRLLEKAPHYSIIHVDNTIKNIQRSFSFDGTSICDAFQEIAEEIGCLFVYNSNSGYGGKIQRTISVYDLQQTCNNCGHRGEFTDKCPKCGSTNIKYGYGEDTLIFVTSDELASEGIELVTDTDSVKNCFKLEAGDDLMTATVRNCNPNGTDYIWYFSDSIKEDMSNSLVRKLESYDKLYKQYYNSYVSNLDAEMLADYNSLVNKYSVYNDDLQSIKTPITGYSNLMNAYYNTIDLALYLRSGLMPSIKISETSAQKQASLLTASSLSPVATNNDYVKSISLSTANSAVSSMAKIIVRSTYKVEVNNSAISEDIYSDENGEYKLWTGNFIITNYSDEDDTAVSDTITVKVNIDAETFIKQKIDKSLNKDDTDDYSISGLFKKEYGDFCVELKKYALNPLKSFYDSCDSCLNILIDNGVGNKDEKPDLYEKLYQPYYNKSSAISEEIKIREDEIAIIEGVWDKTTDENNPELITKGLQHYIEECRNEIQDALDFEKYLGKELWTEFCSYRREDTYSNDNYISDGLNNVELFEKALEFIEVAENEIYKSSELQHSISTTLNNLLTIKKFKPLIDSFEIGNWIRVQIDEKIYKLRLLEYDIDFGSFDNISVEFSDVTKIKNGITDIESILSQASSMATSYSSTQRQAKQGNDAQGTIDHWLLNGLNSALVQIQNNNNEEITLSKNGLLGRSYDEITDTYSPEQFRLTHNIMAYTTDNWKTVSSALGKHSYTKWVDNNWIQDVDYGLSSKFVNAGYVTGSQIIGGEIVSSNYKSGESGTHINLIDGDFEFAGGKIVFDTKDDALTLRDVKIEWANTNAPEVTVNDITGIDEYLEKLDNIGDQLDSRAETWYQSSDPSTAWNTEDLKAFHAGDLWHYTGETGIVNGTNRVKNSEWIWQKVNGVYTWVLIEISDDVFDAIDGKAQIFTSTPVPPYYVKDLWVQGSSGDIKHCVKERKSGESFSQSDWVKSSKYTDDTKANSAYELADSAKGIAENAKELGETISNGLGFKTSVTGEYIISPVIAGGHLLIGDKTGTYAQISADGTLTCKNANISGTVTGSDFIGGYLLIGDKTGETYAEITSSGVLNCEGVDISGKITATEGSIGGWNINFYSLYKKTNNGEFIISCPDSSDVGSKWIIAIKTGDTYPFVLRQNGVLSAEGVDISGKITATEGSIGGWNIGTNALQSVGTNAGFYLYAPSTLSDSNSWMMFSSVTNSDGTSSYPFVITRDGKLTVTGADIQGVLTAGNGSSIAGFTIGTAPKLGTSALYASRGGYEVGIGGGSANTNLAFYVKRESDGEDLFYVKNNGTMCAKAGTIGGWTINDSSLGVIHKIGEGSSVVDRVDILINIDDTGVHTSDNSGTYDYSAPWYWIAGAAESWGETNSYESDVNVKNSICVFNESYELLFDNLIPCRYKYNYGTSDRFHTGFIAQEVVNALECSGLSTQDFAAVIHLDKPNTNGAEWLLRRDEFVALNTWQIQKLKLRVAELEEKIKNLNK